MTSPARLRSGGMLYAPVPSLDAAGQQSPAFGAGIPVYYMLKGAPGTKEGLIADQTLAQAEYRVRINHRAAVGPGWRMVIRESGRPIVLDIVGEPIDPDGRRRWTDLIGLTNTHETRAAQGWDPAAIAGTALTIAQMEAELQAAREALGTQPRLLSYLLPGEALATHWAQAWQRVQAAGRRAAMLDAGDAVVLWSSVDLPAGCALYGLGQLTFTAGNLRMSSGCEVLDLRVRGAGRTNAGTGISVYADAADVLIGGTDIREVAYNGVNINARTRRVRVLRNTIDDVGGGAFDRSWQGYGVYAGSSIDLRIGGNAVTRSRGDGAYGIFDCESWALDRNSAADTAWRGVNVSGSTTRLGVMRSNTATRCGEINEGTSLVNGKSGVGTNGFFCAFTRSAWDVIAHDNTASYCGENAFEGVAAWVDCRGSHTGHYPALTTPSKEGMYLALRAGGDAASAVAYRCEITDTEHAGIFVYAGGGSWAGPEIRGCTIERAGSAGIDILVESGSVEGVLLQDNILRGPAAATGSGITLRATGGGSYGSARVVGNTMTGYPSVSLPAHAEQSGNSWQRAA